MPCVARIDWVLRQVQYGRLLHIATGRANDQDKVKFKLILLEPNAGGLSEFVKDTLTARLQHLRMLAQRSCSIDRGH